MRALVVSGQYGPEAVAAVCQRLDRLGVSDVVVVPGGDRIDQLAAIAYGLNGRTLVVDSGLIVAEASLGQLVDDPAVRSGALVSPGFLPVRAGTPGGADPSAGPLPAAEVEVSEEDTLGRPAPGDGPAWIGPQAGAVTAPTGAATTDQPVRIVQKRIASAGSSVHVVSSANATSLGAFVVAADDVPAAASALLAAVDSSKFAGWDVDPVDLALVALVRAQVPVAAVGSVGPSLRGGTPDGRDAVLADLAGLDEARVLLERANRPDDGFYSTFVLRRVSKPVTALALRLRLKPNQISLLSLFVGLGAAVCFAQGSWPWLLSGAVLLQLSLVIDCVDGEVARFTRAFSDLGAWIDAASDRVKEYAAYAGLAVGAARNGVDLWLLAALVMIVQTVRHMGDYDFSRVQRVRESWVPARPLLDPADGGAAGSGATLELSAKLNENSRVRWAKKVLHMPIGERWLVLSVGAITLGPRWTLVLLLVLALVALSYTTAGRILRTRTWRHPLDRSGWWLLAPQLDLGPLGEPVWNAAVAPRQPLARPFGWAWPPLMRLAELGILWIVVSRLVPEQGTWLFAWAFVVVFHHYDTLYRALGGSTPPRWLAWFGLGWEGRTLLLAACALLGSAALAGLLQVGSVLLALLFVVAGSVQWIRSMARKDGSHA